MSDEELMRFIEDVEENSLHKVPDYLKSVTISRAEQSMKREKRTKEEQLFYYKVRVFAAMAASLILLFAIPQKEPVQKKNEPSIMRTVHMKSNELWNELIFKEDI